MSHFFIQPRQNSDTFLLTSPSLSPSSPPPAAHSLSPRHPTNAMTQAFLTPLPLLTSNAPPLRSTSPLHKPSLRCVSATPPAHRPPPPPSFNNPSPYTPSPITSSAALSTAIALTPCLLILQITRPGCRACAYVTRLIPKLARRYDGRVKFVVMDGYALPELAQSLGVRAMPTFVVYKGGKRVDHFVASRLDSIEMNIQDWL